jgi:PmbA protein
MVERILDLARRDGRVGAADVLWRDEDQLSLKFESGRLKETARRREAGCNLRVVVKGRVGVAGSTDLASPGALEDLLERAVASALQGEAVELAMPAAAPAPPVSTEDRQAASLDVRALVEIGRRVVEPLRRPGWQVGAGVERAVEETRFVNTAGQALAYRATAVGVSAEVTRVAGDDVLIVYEGVTAAGAPADGELDWVVRSIATRMERAERVVEAPEGRLPVLFTPNGSAAVLMPIRKALSGKTVLQGVSPLGGKLGEQLFDPAFTMVDDPLLERRVGSRPADDEGVVSRRLPLIERGVVRAFVYDLETASRAGTGSTGHGRRSTFGKPGINFSNLVMDAGALDEAALLKEMGSGLVVEELIGVGQGNVIGGAFSHPVALAYRVDAGEITGRVKDAAVAGNSYEVLKRVRALGRDAQWKEGTRLVPPLLLDWVSVVRR